MRDDILDDIYEKVLNGNAPGVVESLSQALEAGLDPTEILNDSMIAAMEEVGRQFEIQEAWIPEMLISARAMKAGLELIRPRLVEAAVKPAGTVVLGTVQGDMHDVGKNLVGMMLEGIGFEVIDLGVNVSPQQFVEAMPAHQPDILALSTLLTTTLAGIPATIESLIGAGLRESVCVMIGGAPVSQEFAEEVGADLYAPDAASGSALAKKALQVG
jgi:5-methyltetrahydrofolate--homocysteine methyltransferase